jgi:iron(III) transport system ATP-binding protein
MSAVDRRAGPVPGSPAVAVRGLRRRFGATVAVDALDLEVRPAELLTILGPSGCGKTTVLRLIAGLDRPDTGVIEIGGRRVTGSGVAVPPERRRVGMVFQDVALFPHLSVRDNVGYGIRRDPDREVRVRELLELIDLPDAADRMPHQLSGGMQQRVAVARALAPRPDVVLFDEPFSSLDAALRTQLRGEIREVLAAAGTAAVFVTHDQDEALSLGDRVAVMVRGRIDQVATPEVVYGEPTTPFVATFVGVADLVHAELRGSLAQTRFGVVRLVRPPRDGATHGLVVLRPEHLEVVEAPDGPADAGAWRIARRRFAGTGILLEVIAPDGDRLWVEAGHAVRRLRIGDAVEVRLREVETVAFPASPAAPVVPRSGDERLADLADPLDRLEVEGVAEHEDDLADTDPAIVVDEGRHLGG